MAKVELRLGKVLRWPITSRSTLHQGLYRYDAIGRLQEVQIEKRKPEVNKYLELGPLGTALLPTARPRALLIDEIDKSDIDLPNDLLNIFEEGEFEIPELARLEQRTVEVRAYRSTETFPISNGHVQCCEFPFVVLTNNGEREFPPAFLRRCLRLNIEQPNSELLGQIVVAHLGKRASEEAMPLIKMFLERRASSELATDQLLNAIFLVMEREGVDGMQEKDRESVIDALLEELAKMEKA